VKIFELIGPLLSLLVVHSDKPGDDTHVPF